MSQDTRAVAVPSRRAEATDEPGQRSIVLALLAMVVLLDQTTKWWAWRHCGVPSVALGRVLDVPDRCALAGYALVSAA